MIVVQLGYKLTNLPRVGRTREALATFPCKRGARAMVNLYPTTPPFDLSQSHDFYRHIPGFPDYCIGRDGSVWSRLKRGGARLQRWAPLHGNIKKGYRYVLMRAGRGNTSQSHRVHRLVLETFVGPCPPGMQACHYDGNRANNALNNLRWDTSKNNVHDSIRLGRVRRGERQSYAKLCAADIPVIRELIHAGHSQRQIARQFNVNRTTIRSIAYGITWRHIPRAATQLTLFGGA